MSNDSAVMFKSFPQNKGLGSDGLTAEFYQTFEDNRILTLL